MEVIKSFDWEVSCDLAFKSIHMIISTCVAFDVQFLNKKPFQTQSVWSVISLSW